MLKDKIKSLTPRPVLNWVFGRMLRVFALGVPKSGTTSIASMFSEYCRTGHEPRRPATVDDMYAHFKNEQSDQQLVESYRARDKQLLLDLESNCFLAYRPDLLYSAFPESKFIVTIREPLPWLDSIFDNNLNFPRHNTKTMTKWHEVLFQSVQNQANKEDAPLIELGLYPLDDYLAYWSRTYELCLDSIPIAQRIVVGTNQISNRKKEIGDFVGFDLSNARSKNSHRNSTVDKHDILRRLDQDYVAERIEQLCQPLISQFNLAKLWK